MSIYHALNVIRQLSDNVSFECICQEHARNETRSIRFQIDSNNHVIH